MNPKVDFYFDKAGRWQEAVNVLRPVVLDCGLDEVLKWGCPCYTYGDRNVVLIHDFKEYCALLFFKGALLQDAKKLLIQQTPNVQAARQMRFTSVAEIQKLEKTIKAYIYEAIEVEKSGLKVPMKKKVESMPEEFTAKLSGKAGAKLKAAFDALTPGRRRAYVLFFSAPKQSKTREARIEKCAPRILEGKGLND